MKLQLVQEVLIELFPRLSERDVLGSEQRLREDLELDSLDMVNLQVALEDKCAIYFDPIETDLTEVFETIGTVAAYLDNHVH